MTLRLTEMRERMGVSALSTHQERWFQALDTGTQAIIQLLIETRASQSKELCKHFAQLTDTQSKEHEKNCSYFDYKAEGKRKNLMSLDLLESLRFPSMKERYEGVVDAHEKTFWWIFQKIDKSQRPWDNFVMWLFQGSGIYWIQGKAASGKSTLLRFIWNNEMTLANLRSWSKDSPLIVAAFFFWKSGTPIQRSQIGLLRSLLYDTLKNRHDLISEVFPNAWKYSSDLTADDLVITVKTWTLPQLQRAFSNLVSLANPQLHLCFFIDGLDEYDGDVEEIAQYFRDLSVESPYAKFCLSSRPWPVFLDIYEGTLGLRLQDLTQNDIKLYVNDKLGSNKHMQGLLKQDPGNGTKMIDELIRKAAGVFLWVVLVVKSLIRGLRNGDGITHLRCRLGTLPSDLENLYKHMLDGIEPLYREEAAQIFRIFRASGHDLNIDTLERSIRFTDFRQAIYMRIEKADEVQETQEVRKMASERMAARLNSRCKGLLELQNEDESNSATECRIEMTTPLDARNSPGGKSWEKWYNEVSKNFARIENDLEKQNGSNSSSLIKPPFVCPIWDCKYYKVGFPLIELLESHLENVHNYSLKSIFSSEVIKAACQVQTSLERDIYGLTYRLKNELQTVEDLYEVIYLAK